MSNETHRCGRGLRKPTPGGGGGGGLRRRASPPGRMADATSGNAHKEARTGINNSGPFLDLPQPHAGLSYGFRCYPCSKSVAPAHPFFRRSPFSRFSTIGMLRVAGGRASFPAKKGMAGFEHLDRGEDEFICGILHLHTTAFIGVSHFQGRPAPSPIAVRDRSAGFAAGPSLFRTEQGV